MEALLAVIHEDSDLLVINKPAGLVCHPTKADGHSSLISRVRRYLGRDRDVHLINRLDRETSGVVLVAKHLNAARILRRVWESREVRKEYLAIVKGRVRDEQAVIEAPLGRDSHSRVAIKDCVRPDGAPARTDFRTERRFRRDCEEFTLLRVWPRTGRKHQIRIHLAQFGYPIVGDKLYGGDENLYLDFVGGCLTDEQRHRLILPFHALHALRIDFPWRDAEFGFRAEPEPWFASFASCSIVTSVVQTALARAGQNKVKFCSKID